jgi:carboxypeptidase Taq
MNPSDSYRQLLRRLREIALLRSVTSLLNWDERTNLPPAGTAHRAEQLALLSRMNHQQFTSPLVGELLAAVEDSELVQDGNSDAAVNVRETRRSYDRARKLPAELVEDMTRTEVLAQQAWVNAKRASSFVLFRPWLEKIVDQKRREAECIGNESEPYDALVDDYEPYETAASLRAVFDELRQPLVELVRRVIESGRKAPIEVLQRRFPADAQERFAREAAGRVGFDFSAGRLDTTVHPFCSWIGPGDVRLTTRYDENWFGDAFFGTVHESGHGMYDQGLEAEHWGTPRGQAVSLGIHESQSRLWQVMVGHSRGFWRFFFPRAKEAFPQALHDVTQEQWLFAINDIRPSLIRTEADTATYNLHILLRMELERALIEGGLEAADVPAAWNEKMREYLGIEPPDDARGCLQDIHWSGGAFGYFPTYTLGNLYAAQLMEKARQDLGDVEEHFARGEFADLLQWLREKIHRHGKRHRPRRLIELATGSVPSAAPLLRYLQRKTAEFYEL